MVLFGRDRLPSRSALSRFLAALDQASVEALRSVSYRTRWLVRDLPRAWEGCGTGRDTAGSSSIWAARDKPHDNARCLRARICRRPSGDSNWSVPLATPDASGEKWSGPAPRSSKPIPISGW